MIRTRRRARVLALLVVGAAALTACGGGASTSRAGTRLLRAAAADGRRSDAVSFEVRARGRGRSDEAFARRGGDSLVQAEYDDDGLLEVRVVGGTVFVRTALRIEGAPTTGPWLRIDAGPEQTTWLALLGAALTAPTPERATALLTANVRRVTGVQSTGGARRLAVEPDAVASGERPSRITLRADAPSITGRVAELYAGGARASTRTYSRVRWGARATPITAPDGAVPIDGALDPQATALASTLLREPTDLPAGWTRRATVAVTPVQGSGTCQEVATIYAAPAPAPISAGYLAAYLEPSGCAPVRQAGSADFVAGPNRGWIGTDPTTGATIGSLTVEGTAVRFRSSLPPATLASVLAGWRPVSLG